MAWQRQTEQNPDCTVFCYKISNVTSKNAKEVIK